MLDATELNGKLVDVLKQIKSLGKNELMTRGITELTELVRFTQTFEKKIIVDLSLARGLDYYTGNVFEGAVEGGKWSVAGGGRYDNLVERYGGRPTPATGMSIGIERVIQLMDERGLFSEAPQELIYVAPVNDKVRDKALEITQKLRAAGIPTETDLMGRKLAKQFAYADSIGTKKVVIIGPKDLENGKVTVRDMTSGNEKNIPLSQLVSFIKTVIKSD